MPENEPEQAFARAVEARAAYLDAKDAERAAHNLSLSATSQACCGPYGAGSLMETDPVAYARKRDACYAQIETAAFQKRYKQARAAREEGRDGDV